MNIYLDARAQKKYKKLLKRDRHIAEKLDEAVSRFRENSKHPSLRIHKLSGKKEEAWSISAAPDSRIIFVYVTDGILIVDIGSHDEVY